MVARVALIQDHHRIRESLGRVLVERGHDVRPTATDLIGLRWVVDERPDAVILDLVRPDTEGLKILKVLRAVTDVPVIVATAREDEAAVVRTLNAGADDCLVRPFSPEQLEARLQAVLRRIGPGIEEPIVVGALRIDTSSRVATLDRRPLDLTRKEFDLMAYLASRSGRVVTKRELLAEIWHQPYGGADKTVDVHLSWLRHKLGETAAAPRYIRAVRGVGVKLVDPGAGWVP